MTLEELNILILNLCNTLIDIIEDENAEDENAEDIILTLTGTGDKRRIQVDIKVIEEENDGD